MKKILVLVALFILGASDAQNIQSSTNAGLLGPLLPLLDAWQDATTDCESSNTDLSASTGTTQSLDCANTGEVVIDGFLQMTVDVNYELDGGTDSEVKMQCDKTQELSSLGASKWMFVPTEDAEGNKGVRTWTWTASADGAFPNNFIVSAQMLRCRFWIVGGGSSRRVKYNMRMAH